MLSGLFANMDASQARETTSYLQQTGQLQPVVGLMIEALSKGYDKSDGSAWNVKYGDFSSYKAMANIFGDSPELKAYADLSWELRDTQQDLSSFADGSPYQERQIENRVAELTAQQAAMKQQLLAQYGAA